MKVEAMIPKLMGVVNVTPDSFSDGGRHDDPARAVAHGLALVEEGADILDIGGESTRPGAELVPVEEEIARVVPAIEGLAARTPTPISIDTRKPEVARAAVAAGATIWNDVAALAFSPESLQTAANLGVDIVLMHAQGDPKTMQAAPRYDDVVEEVYAFLAERIEAATAAGVAADRLIVDPGVGFGKTPAHNLVILKNLHRFKGLGCPILLGVSRKRFIAAIDRDGPADQRLGGSLAAALSGLAAGVDIVRVHDVAATRQAFAVARAIASAS